MPRQIIDTESSRPAYVRRRARRFVVSALIFVLVVAAIWFLAHRALGQESRAAEGTALRQVQGEKCSSIGSKVLMKGVPCAR